MPGTGQFSCNQLLAMDRRIHTRFQQALAHLLLLQMLAGRLRDTSDGEIARKVEKLFDMRPYFIEQRFNLRSPIYLETAAYGHMGREPRVIEKIFNKGKANEKKVKVELFPWEKLDYVDQVKKVFGL
jgi:S-adenosylmethionine synthetase